MGMPPPELPLRGREVRKPPRFPPLHLLMTLVVSCGLLALLGLLLWQVWKTAGA